MPVYVYGITDRDHPLGLDGASGVGPQAAPPRAVPAGALAAVVSDAPDDLRAKRRDLAAHQDVLRRLGDQGPVLPMRFGLVAPDERALVAELTEHEAEYTQRLRALENQVEYNLRARQDEDVALRDALNGSPRVRQLSLSTRGGGGSLEERVALGEAVADEVAALQARLGEEILRDLAPLTTARVDGAAVADAFLNVSVLVERSKAEAFETAARQVFDRHAKQGVECQLYGPLPPYSFV